jgi:NAD(P)-dependent dehydrogenase (short-subunit alcohol dehydrogenase family)
LKISSVTAAIVSGGASGLGMAVVKRLCLLGAKVTIFDQNEMQGEKLAKETSSHFVKVNIADYNSVSEGLNIARARFGSERICVNCAGIALAEKTVSRGKGHNKDLFKNVLSVNLGGTFNLATQSALEMSDLSKINESNERGVIVNTASIAAYEGQIGQLAYSASKAGVLGMTLPMARDLAQYGIRVMTVAPGIFSTPMVEGLPDEVQDNLAMSIPFPSRLGRPEEFADLIIQIIENPMLNGEVIRLDGAVRLQPR